MLLWVCSDCGWTSSEPAGDCVACWVRQSCEAQGKPEKVTDADTLRNVAVLLATSRGTVCP